MSGAAQTARQVLRAPQAKTPVPIRMPAPAVRAAQAAAAVPVSRPGDAGEREAARVARRVVAMPATAAAPQARRFAAAMPAARSAAPSALGVSASPGRPLPERVRGDMESRFGADFSGVRVHTGDSAASASRRLNAAAFTAGRDVFFGRGRFQPGHAAGRELIAHELAHTVQQGGAVQAPVQRSVDTTVRERVPESRVHRLGIQDALDYFAEKAAWIPGFTMLTLLLGFNPVSLRSVSRTAANLLRALIQLLPGGPLITQALDNHGILDRVAAWAEGQLSTLGEIGASIRQAIDDFLDSLSWTDIFDLGGVWERAKRIVTAPIDRIVAFGSSLIGGIVDFIKDAILRPVAALVEPTRGYPLLKAVLGFDPITGDPVPRTPAALIGGFMTLIGQDEVWQNIQRGNAIGQAWAWFQTAMGELMGFVQQIPSLFLAAFRSLEIVDIVLVPRAFAKIIGVFGSFAARFLSWALGTVLKLLEIVFSVVAPGAMPYLRRVGAAIASIFRNPIGFVTTLVRAAKAGFQRFAHNFVTHLQAGLIAWLTGSLPGIYIPRGFNLPEILKFALSVLGLTWANIRGKLVRAVGEPAVRAMEMGFEIVVTLVRDGPAAAWEQIKQSLADLKAMVIDGIKDMIVGFVVTKAIPKLVAMFIPGAGFITAIIAIYDTVMTIVHQLARIAQVVRSFLDSLVSIANGVIDAAAARVEATLANLLTLAINFLAGFAGLGKIADKVRAIIERIRAPIDRALDRAVEWIVAMARRVGRFVAQAGVPNDPNERLRLAVGHARRIAAGLGRRLPRRALEPALSLLTTRYALNRLELLDRGGRWWVRASINPTTEEDTGATVDDGRAGGPVSAEDRETLRQIYEIADQEYAAARAEAAKAGKAPPGTHEAPRIVPPGGLTVVAAAIQTDLGRGRIDVLDVTQAANTPLRGVVQRPGFGGGDAIVSGATTEERRVPVGRYREVGAALASLGNDRYAAEAAIAVLAGGSVPERFRSLGLGWVGGFKTLMALEVRRDPIALVTLSSVLTLAAAGALPISAAFAKAGETADAAATSGGAFPHTARPALGPLRGARDEVGAPVPADAPASRGTAEQRDQTLAKTIDAIAKAAQLELRSKAKPSRDEMLAAVRRVMKRVA